MAAWCSSAKKLAFSFHGHSVLLLMLFLLFSSARVGHCDSAAAVQSLPGFEGPLPFEFETGYVGVGDSEDSQLFYYFVKSESNPIEDPLLLWITGGPCCSGISGFIFEIGPLAFGTSKKDGNLPTLALNPNSWSKVASIIFVDWPVGSGFSYSATSDASGTTDFQSCEQAHEFIRKWIIGHPEFASNSLYVGGDSYSGIIVPIVTQLISNGNEAGLEPFINLKGYVLGNAVTKPAFENNYYVPYAHGMGLISDELYKSLERSCQGEYSNIDPSNKECLQYHEAFTECTKGLNQAQILEPSCGFASPKPHGFVSERRSLDERSSLLLARESSLCASSRIDRYRLSSPWLNDEGVREALHIRKGSIGKWIRCQCRLPYKTTIASSLEYHVKLSTMGLRSLLYSGDHDMIVTYLGTQAWIRSLNYSIVDDWRPWTVQGQISGYTRTYSNRMTFATVKGGGHTAPEYRPIECFAMFSRWIANQPL